MPGNGNDRQNVKMTFALEVGGDVSQNGSNLMEVFVYELEV